MDHHGVVLEGDGLRRHGQELFQKRRIEAVPGKAKVGELLRIGHAADPVVELHQLVGGHDLATARVLLRGEAVLDDLKDGLIAGQHEHRHHHALNAWGQDEGVVGLIEVGQKVPVKLRFPVAVEANGGIELVEGLAREEGAQIRHQDRGVRRIHEEIGAGKAEDHGQIVFRGEHGIDHQRPGFVVHDRNGHGVLFPSPLKLPHKVGALVAEEHGSQEGEATAVACGCCPPKGGIDGPGEVGSIPRPVLPGRGEGVVREQLIADGGPALRRRGFVAPGGAIRWIGGCERGYGVHEEIVVEHRLVVPEAAVDGVKEGFRQLPVPAPLAEGWIGVPGGPPYRQARLAGEAKVRDHASYGLRIAFDAGHGGRLPVGPGGCFKAGLGAPGDFPKALPVGLKALEHVFGDGNAAALFVIRGGSHRRAPRWLQWGRR